MGRAERRALFVSSCSECKVQIAKRKGLRSSHPFDHSRGIPVGLAAHQCTSLSRARSSSARGVAEIEARSSRRLQPLGHGMETMVRCRVLAAPALSAVSSAQHRGRVCSLVSQATSATPEDRLGLCSGDRRPLDLLRESKALEAGQIESVVAEEREVWRMLVSWLKETEPQREDGRG
jgi:hypothetical protein